MPYFVFAVRGFGMLDKLAEFASFREASQHAKQLRSERAADPAAPRIKLIFGETQTAAEDALLQVREPGPSGDD